MEDESKEEWRGLPPHLFPKRTHQPPAGYFESLPDKLMHRWKDEEKRIHQRRVFIRRWISIAAISCGILFGAWWIVDQPPAPFAALNSKEAYQYVMENIRDFDGLLDQQAQWPKEEKISIPDSSAAQEYLLEELQGNEIEQIF